MKTKGGKTMNPTDAYRKELRKKELKRNKKERKKVREVGILKKDPEAIKDQIKKLDTMNADGALDKTRRHKKRQLEDTLSLVIKKRKEYEDKMKEKGEDPVMFSHLPVPRRRTTAEEEQRTPLPEDSVYYHPTLNPTGHPPPGKPPMYKSSLGPRIPLSGDDLEGSLLLPPPPPPPPLPTSKEDTAGEEPLDPLRVPVPPPPPAPPRPPSSTGKPPPPPPPTGAPGLENVHVSIPAPPPPPRPLQPPPPGTNGEASPAEAKEESAKNVETASVTEPATASKSIDDFHDSEIDSEEVAALTRPSAPSPVVRLPSGPPQNSGIEVAPPGISRIAIPPAPSTRPPPPPPPRMPPPTMVPAMGMLPPIPPPQMSHFGFPPPGLPPVGMAYGVPPMPPRAWEGTGNGDYGKIAKPFYVKSAAPTVVKRPLAHHTPELTAMVPASVRVRRETSQKVKPRPAAAATAAPSTTARPTTVATKPPSIDDSYSAFLEDMKALGAFEGGMK